MKKIFLFFVVIFASISSISYAENNNIDNDALNNLSSATQQSENNVSIVANNNGDNDNIVSNNVSDENINNNDKIYNNSELIPIYDEYKFVMVNKKDVNSLRNILLKTPSGIEANMLGIISDTYRNIQIFQNNGNNEIIEQMKDERMMSMLIKGDNSYAKEKVFISKKSDLIMQNNTSTSTSYFNNSFFKSDGGISGKNMMIFDIYNLDFSYASLFQQEYGDYIKDNWRVSSNKSFQVRFVTGIGYARSITNSFKPYIGAYFNFAMPLVGGIYTKTFSTDDTTPGLKHLTVQEEFGIEAGLKFGNIIEVENSYGPWLPYVSIGYANIDWNLYSKEKVTKTVETTIDGVTKKENKLEDRDNNSKEGTTAHFVAFGVGLEKYFFIFKIGIYAKYLYPLNNIMLHNENNNLVNFGRHSHISAGITLGFANLSCVF